jgi:HSP20 family protein
MSHALSHFEPFHELSRLGMFRRLDDMLGNNFLPAATDVMPLRIDIAESDQAYTLRTPLPGLRREDIRVSVQGSRVTVEAESRREEDKKDEKTIRSERFFGRQYRSVVLDHEVDEAKADARYLNGVLELVLPKKPGRNGHRLAIH